MLKSEEPVYIPLGFTVQGAKKLLVGLIAIEILFVLIFVTDSLLGLPGTVHRHFSLDLEANIPSWFSSIQLFLIGLLMSLVSRQRNVRYPPPVFLLIIGLGFIFLSMDEAAQVHERLTRILTGLGWTLALFKGGHGGWILPYFIIGSVLCLLGFRNFVTMWNCFRRETFIVTMGMGMLLFGAMGLEIASYQFLRSGTTPLLYQGEVALEEFFEMSGASVILYGTILLAHNRAGPIEIPKYSS